MAAFKNVGFIIFVYLCLVITLCIIISLCFVKYDFDSKIIDGKNMKDIIDQYKSNMPNLDEKCIKSLFFGFYMIREMNSDLVKKLILKDGNKLTKNQLEKANKRFRIYENEHNSDDDTESYDDVIDLIKKHFFSFEIKKMDSKNIFEVTSEDKKFIFENDKVIKELEKICDRFFKKDCAKYIKKRNIIILGDKKEFCSSIELNIARYARFVL